jgi:hypothetical protein
MDSAAYRTRPRFHFRMKGCTCQHPFLPKCSSAICRMADGCMDGQTSGQTHVDSLHCFAMGSAAASSSPPTQPCQHLAFPLAVASDMRGSVRALFKADEGAGSSEHRASDVGSGAARLQSGSEVPWIKRSVSAAICR